MSLRKFKRAILASSVAALVLSPHLHAEDLNSDSIIRQLLPKDPTPSTPLLGPTPVDVGTLTSADVLTRLSPGEGRSLGATTQHPASVRLVDGREADTLASIQAFPSMQIAVAFQGSSDALAPDSTVLISVLGQALRSQKLASSKILIGVQTNALGSDAYNLSLSQLRAKAIIDQLVAVQGIGRERLFAVGFGRGVDPSSTAAGPQERVRVVNLENASVTTGSRLTPSEPSAPTASLALRRHPHRVFAAVHRPRPNTERADLTIAHLHHLGNHLNRHRYAALPDQEHGPRLLRRYRHAVLATAPADDDQPEALFAVGQQGYGYGNGYSDPSGRTVHAPGSVNGAGPGAAGASSGVSGSAGGFGSTAGAAAAGGFGSSTGVGATGGFGSAPSAGVSNGVGSSAGAAAGSVGSAAGASGGSTTASASGAATGDASDASTPSATPATALSSSARPAARAAAAGVGRSTATAGTGTSGTVGHVGSSAHTGGLR